MARLNSSAFLPSIDADLQRFFNEYFIDTDSDDDDVEFEGFTPNDIRGRPVYLINLIARLPPKQPHRHRSSDWANHPLALPFDIVTTHIHRQHEGPTCVKIWQS